MNSKRIWALIITLFIAAPSLAASRDELVGAWAVSITQSSGDKTLHWNADLRINPDGSYRLVREGARNSVVTSGSWQIDNNVLTLHRTAKSIGDLVLLSAEDISRHQVTQLDGEHFRIHGSSKALDWQWELQRTDTPGNNTTPIPERLTTLIKEMIVGSWCNTSPSRQKDNSAAKTWIFHNDGKFEQAGKHGPEEHSTWKLDRQKLEIGAGPANGKKISHELVGYSSNGDRLVISENNGGESSASKTLWYHGACSNTAK